MYKWNLIERVFITKIFDNNSYLYFFHSIFRYSKKRMTPCIKKGRSNTLCMHDGPEGKKVSDRRITLIFTFLSSNTENRSDIQPIAGLHEGSLRRLRRNESPLLTHSAGPGQPVPLFSGTRPLHSPDQPPVPWCNIVSPHHIASYCAGPRLWHTMLP